VPSCSSEAAVALASNAAEPDIKADAQEIAASANAAELGAVVGRCYKGRLRLVRMLLLLVDLLESMYYFHHFLNQQRAVGAYLFKLGTL
jgi:uncharacterized membrane protein (UPF0136 family)